MREGCPTCQQWSPITRMWYWVVMFAFCAAFGGLAGFLFSVIFGAIFER